jgi:formylglycine-generating enzyme required for sulfatase activity
MDMSGNVWEWCLSDYDKPAIDAAKENLRTGNNRVLRGGSWFDVLHDARSAYRYIFHPADRNFSIGCRVVSVVRPSSLNL